MSSNSLKMPLAEWLFRMAEADVPYQARGLAVYAVLFKVSSNEDLAKLSGMDTKGLADKTYNKWKKLLADDGWVILKAVTVGRETTIEIFPALKTSPVTFTDVSPRDPARFGKNKSYGREEQITSESYERNVTFTDETEKVTVEKVKVTDETKTSPAPAHADSNNIYNNYNNLPKYISLTEQLAASAREGGTVEIGHGVTVNCRAISHQDFKIDLGAIELHTLGRVPLEEIRLNAAGHALEWASQIADGKPPRDVLPKNGVTQWIARSFHYRKLDTDVNDVRKAKAAIPKEAKSDKLKRLFQAVADEKGGG